MALEKLIFLDNLVLHKLSPDTKEYSAVSLKFKETMPSSKITEIVRIQNKWLWEKYWTQKNFIDKKNAKVLDSKNTPINNERWLFHGTRGTPPTSIYNGQDGFDLKFSSGGMWGRGSYFASRAAYSNGYAYKNGNTLQMFYATVLVGDTKSVPANGSLTMPPLKEKQEGIFDEERYDSVEAQTGSVDVNYVVYDICRAYPAYLISYDQ